MVIAMTTDAATALLLVTGIAHVHVVARLVVMERVSAIAAVTMERINEDRVAVTERNCEEHAVVTENAASVVGAVVAAAVARRHVAVATRALGTIKRPVNMQAPRVHLPLAGHAVQVATAIIASTKAAAVAMTPLKSPVRT